MRKISLEPIYRSIVNRILLGSLAEGSHLPPERELAQQYGLARNTLRMVLKRLEEDGYLIRRRGLGTVVSNPHGSRVIYFLIPYPDFLSSCQPSQRQYADWLLSQLNQCIQGLDTSVRLLSVTEDNEYGHVSESSLSVLRDGDLVFCNSSWYLPAFPLLLERKVRLVFLSGSSEWLPKLLDPTYRKQFHFMLMDRERNCLELYRRLVERGARRIALFSQFLNADHPLVKGFQGGVARYGGDGTLWFGAQSTPLEIVSAKRRLMLFKECLETHHPDAVILNNFFLDDGALTYLRDLVDMPPELQLGILGKFTRQEEQEENSVVSVTDLVQAVSLAVDRFLAPVWRPEVTYLTAELCES